VLSAVLTGLLIAIALYVGVALSPRILGVQLTGSAGNAYVIVSVAFAVVTGAILGLGFFTTRNGTDWSPLLIAVGVFFIEFCVFVLVLVSILRRLARNNGSRSIGDSEGPR
jgi:hypothetical protein